MTELATPRVQRPIVFHIGEPSFVGPARRRPPAPPGPFLRWTRIRRHPTRVRALREQAASLRWAGGQPANARAYAAVRRPWSPCARRPQRDAGPPERLPNPVGQTQAVTDGSRGSQQAPQRGVERGDGAGIEPSLATLARTEQGDSR